MAAEKASAAENADLILKKGERIPRKPHIGYSEAGSLIEAWFRDGFFGTAMNDKNQYGPVTMMILLIIVSSITGTVLKLFT